MDLLRIGEARQLLTGVSFPRERKRLLVEALGEDGSRVYTKTEFGERVRKMFQGP